MAREHLPATRPSITHKVILTGEEGTVNIYFTAGMFPDGRLGEIFIKAGSVNSIKGNVDFFGLNGWCNVLGVLISLLLQNQVPLEDICHHLENQSFKPDGWSEATMERNISIIGRSKKSFFKSIPDALARWLQEMFPGGKLKP